MLGCVARMVLLSGWLCSETALAWTVPVEISGSSSSERSTPRIARGNSGALHVVYINKASSNWQTLYRPKSAAGVWGSVEQISTGFSTRPDVAEDSTGRPHVVLAQTNTGGSLDLYHRYKDNGIWTGGYIALTTDYEDEPRLVADSTGHIHMIYTRTTNESSGGSVMYRVWTSGSWSAETNLGSVTNSYYHRPDLTIDSAGNLHAVWAQLVSGSYKVHYRKNTGGSWGATIDAGSGTINSPQTHFFAYPRVAAASPSNICVVWHDDYSGGSALFWNYSSNGGASWTFALAGTEQGQLLYSGHYPQLDSGTTGSVHLINEGGNADFLIYSKWTGGGSWAINQQTIFTNSFWKGWPDITEDNSGFVHAVWDDEYGPSTSDHRIMYSTTIPDTIPPAPVTNFATTSSQGTIHLSWTNPPDLDFNGTMIRYSNVGYPVTPTDGTLVYNVPMSPGTSDSYDHIGLTNGTRYYYTAFAHDAANLYSSGVNSAARPSINMDRDTDADVDQSDFGALQLCFNVQGSLGSNCFWADVNVDGAVNSVDFSAFLGCQSGADVPYNPTCAD